MGSSSRADVRQVPQAEGTGPGRIPTQHDRQPAPRMIQLTIQEMMMKVLKSVLVSAVATLMSVSVATSAEDVVVVYDASGSMWGQIDGVSKIEIAREVLADLVTGWSADTNLGLVAYGHRSEGDCRDIET